MQVLSQVGGTSACGPLHAAAAPTQAEVVADATDAPVLTSTRVHEPDEAPDSVEEDGPGSARGLLRAATEPTKEEDEVAVDAPTRRQGATPPHPVVTTSEAEAEDEREALRAERDSLREECEALRQSLGTAQELWTRPALILQGRT